MDATVTNSLNDSFPAFYSRFAADILGVEETRGDIIAVVKPGKIREMFQFLRDDPSLAFHTLMDLFAMDYLKYEPEKPERYAVVYNLFSLTYHRRLFLKVYLSESVCEVDSLHDLTPAANWFEREAWDLFGIVFKGHPNLIRILCHNEFVGHPLRKDYPSDGYQRLKSAAISSGI